MPKQVGGRAGSRQRSQLVQRHFDQLVALHRELRDAHQHVVLAVVDSSAAQLVPAAALGSVVVESAALVAMSRAQVAAWLAKLPLELGKVDTAKWHPLATDAMDVAAVTPDGISVMRFTAR